MPILIPCPRCAGTGTDTHEDRHAETRQDVCGACAPYADVHPGMVPAQTGETREASFDPVAGGSLGYKVDLHRAHVPPVRMSFGSLDERDAEAGGR